MTKPRIAIIGYGNMGREIERAALSRGLTVQAIIDVQPQRQGLERPEEALAGVDVCVEFTTPDAVLENVRMCASAGKNLVIGTTGWGDRLDEGRGIAEGADIGVIYGSNFSIGVHIFLKLVSRAGEILGLYPQYDAAVHETHHTGKKDAPSGTALSIAAELLRLIPSKVRIDTVSATGRVAADALIISSARVGSVPGTHTVTFDSTVDTIELIHTARGRQGFAEGALLAAEWIHHRKGFFTIQDMLHEIESV